MLASLFRTARNVFCSLASLTLLISQPCLATEVSTDTPRYKIFTAFLPPTIPPYHWLDPCQNKLQGSRIHILARAAKQAGIKLDIHYLYKPEQWPKREHYYQQVKDGKYDGIWGYAIHFQDERFVTSTQPYSSYNASILIHNSFKGSSISTEQLKSMTAVLLPVGSSDYFKQSLEALGITIVPVETLKEIYSLIHDNDHYFSIMDQYFGLTRLRTSSDVKNLKFIDWAGVSLDRYLHLTVSKDSQLYKELPKLDKAYKEFYQQGYPEFINRTYTNLWLQNGGCIKNTSTDVITTTPIE